MRKKMWRWSLLSIWAARLRYGVRCAARSRKSGWIRMQRMRYVFRDIYWTEGWIDGEYFENMQKKQE